MATYLKKNAVYLIWLLLAGHMTINSWMVQQTTDSEYLSMAPGMFNVAVLLFPIYHLFCTKNYWPLLSFNILYFLVWTRFSYLIILGMITEQMTIIQLIVLLLLIGYAPVKNLYTQQKKIQLAS